MFEKYVEASADREAAASSTLSFSMTFVISQKESSNSESLSETRQSRPLKINRNYSRYSVRAAY